MVLAGIISEFNPFHSGHAFLVGQARRNGATHVAAVMSGNFVQRGDAAVLSKWARTRQALLCGVDLVVELPLPWATAGAEKFAWGGVSLLNALDADVIAFGSECGSVPRLEQAAEALSSPRLGTAMRGALESGAAFASARQEALRSLFGDETADLFRDPNNILAIEYLKAMRKSGSKLSPFTVKREGAPHDSGAENGRFASSARIRALLENGGDCSSFLPGGAGEILRAETEAGRAPASLLRAERAVLAKLRGMDAESFAALPDVSEGLENRLRKAVRKAGTLEELYGLVKTKRYSHARIRRIVLSAFLGTEASRSEGVPPYLRILGFNGRGKEILRAVKGTAAPPVVTQSSDLQYLDNRARNMLQLESRSTDLFALCMPEAGPCGLDRTTGIISIEPVLQK